MHTVLTIVNFGFVAGVYPHTLKIAGDSWLRRVKVPQPYQHLDPPEFWEPMDRRPLNEIIDEAFKEAFNDCHKRPDWWGR